MFEERFVPWTLAFAVLVNGALAGTASAAVQRPSYSAGDRWVYILDGSLTSLPGLNDTGIGLSVLTVAGRVELEVVAAGERSVPSGPIQGFEVATRTTAFLNGTFTVPGGPSPLPATVSGTLNSQLVEFWEDAGVFAVESRETATAQVDISFIVPIHVELRTRANATTSVRSEPIFPLDIGQRVTASLTTNLTTNVTVSAFGMENTSEAQSQITTNWSREVLSQESVAVEAGTFAAYRMNQSLTSFPGLGGLAGVPGSNETAFWSNDIGSYVKRVAYANGTAVTELRLQSYTYGSRGNPLLLAIIGFGVLAAAIATIVLVVLRRRKKRMTSMGAGEPPASEIEIGARNHRHAQPPKEDDRAR